MFYIPGVIVDVTCVFDEPYTSDLADDENAIIAYKQGLLSAVC